MKPLPILALLLLALALVGCGEPPQPTISLYRAIQVGDLEQIKRHIRWGTDLNQPDPNGDLPLHVAARAGQVSIARELAGNGANLVAPNLAGQTPLDLALSHGKTKVAQLLLGYGVPLEPQAALLALVRDGISDRDAFDFLIRRGADPNRPDAQGESPLHLAVRLGHLETTRRLLQRGADVNRPDGAGRTPLSLAQDLDPGTSHARDIIATLRQYGARLPADTPRADPQDLETGGLR
ncbi:MAG: ankyrin repeat domain-containing protein [Bdellovibrio bacteriovorus]